MNSNEIQEMKELLKEHEIRIIALEQKFQTDEKPVRKQISIREFLLTKKLQNDIQRTLAIGYYLEQHQNMDKFNTKDLENGFQKAKETVPSNINDKVNMNIKKGYMMEASEMKDNRKAWYLTNSGENFVEAELGN